MEKFWIIILRQLCFGVGYSKTMENIFVRVKPLNALHAAPILAITVQYVYKWQIWYKFLSWKFF